MKIDEINEYVPLFDMYQSLLTGKQKEYFIMYYYEDFSLGEIASNLNVSRNAVFDVVKKTENILKEYESKLHLYEKKLKREKIYQTLDSKVASDLREIEEI